MMNFLPQGYSFQSDSNPYQHQFISPFHGAGQSGWQYSPMAQTGPRLPTCMPGTCPPWLPPGIVATPSSGVRELEVLLDPTLAMRMARAYNAWTVAYWGKPDIPAWLWPDGAAPTPVPPNVCCQFPPCVGPGGYGDGGPSGGPGFTPGPYEGPKLTPGPHAGPKLTPGPVPTPGPKYEPPPKTGPQYKPPPKPGPQWKPPPQRPAPTPGPQIGPGPGPGTSTQPNPNRRGMFNPRWGRAKAPDHPKIVFSVMPLPGEPSVVAANPLRARASRRSGVRVPSRPRGPGKGGWIWHCSAGYCKGEDLPEYGGGCIEGTIGGKAACCCPTVLVNPSSTSLRAASARPRPLTPDCYKASDKAACYRCCTEHATTAAERQKCLSQCVGLPEPKPGSKADPGSTRRRARLTRSATRRSTSGWVSLPGRPRGWCGEGEHLCTKKMPSGKSHFCCCDTSGNCVGGRIKLA